VRSKQALQAAIRDGGRVVLVVNTRSRKGRCHSPRLPTRLAAAGLPVHAAYAIHDPAQLPDILTRALEPAPDLLLFGGGDGSLTAAAARLAHRDAALGVLPLGTTTNNFARSLGMPLNLAGAIAALAAGKVAEVDLAQAGPHLFANMASIGLSVQVAQAVPARLKRVLGRGAYTSPPRATCSPTRPSRPPWGWPGPSRWCGPTSSTSPTAATMRAGASPATPAWTTGCWSSTGSATLAGCRSPAGPSTRW
jgi:Diacylglycerol kinase catalytic domain